MRRAFYSVVAVLAISSFAVGQSATSDTQTLQALLTEVRALRQELRVSLNRTQTMQILLVRFQMQEGAIARASDRVNEARQKLLDTQIHQKELTAEAKQTEEAMDSDPNPQRQADFQDRLKQIKSNLDVLGTVAQQRQTAEVQAEQQLRDEQDKLSALESQLDEVVRAMGSPAEQLSRPK
jgi:chromosome segregation ATPase